jgi:proteasome lid subunit RPN8/RPN11
MKLEKNIKIIIPKTIFSQIKNCTQEASPNEACGLIFGDIKESKSEEGYEYTYSAEKFECIKSSNPSPVSFLINNLEKLNEIFKEASIKYKLRLISIFHSHPGSANPSGFDYDNMKRLDKSGISPFKYLIWTIIDGKIENLNGFLFLKDNLVQIEVNIQKD